MGGSLGIDRVSGYILRSYVLFKRSIAATKEVVRVESVSKSPILNFLSESIAGSSTVRAYGNKDIFLQACM